MAVTDRMLLPPEDRESEFARLRDEIAGWKPPEDDFEGPPPPALPPEAPAAPAMSTPPRNAKLAELEAAQSKARGASKRANLGRAGSELIAALGGYKADNSFWDRTEAQGQQGVADFEKRQALEARKSADDDLDSPQNKAYQAWLDANLPEYMKALPPEIRRGLTVKNHAALFEPVKLKEEIGARNAAAKAKAEAEAAAAEEKRQAQLRDDASIGEILVSRLGVPREDVEKLTYEGKKQLLAERKDSRHVDAAVATREDNQADIARRIAEENARKDRETKEASFLNGWELEPGKRVSAEEAKQLRSAQAGTDTILKSVNELEQLYKTYGTQALPSAARARMRSLATGLVAAMKGPDQFALGVLTGPDLDLINKVVADPTTPEAALMDYFGGDAQTLAKLSALKSQVQNRFAAAATARGFRKAGSAPAAAGGPPGKIKVTNGKQSFWIDLEDEPAAKKDGFHR